MKDQCQEPVQNGKGYWTANDRRFGTGLNLPRTRHTSEILKTRVRTEPDQNTMYHAYKKVAGCTSFLFVKYKVLNDTKQILHDQGFI